MFKKKESRWIYDVSENRITCGYCGASPVTKVIFYDKVEFDWLEEGAKKVCDIFKYCPRCGKRMEGYRFINFDKEESE